MSLAFTKHTDARDKMADEGKHQHNLGESVTSDTLSYLSICTCVPLCLRITRRTILSCLSSSVSPRGHMLCVDLQHGHYCELVEA